MKPAFCIFVNSNLCISLFICIIFCILFLSLHSITTHRYNFKSTASSCTKLNITFLLFLCINYLSKLSLCILLYRYPNTTFFPFSYEIFIVALRFSHTALLVLGTLWLLEIQNAISISILVQSTLASISDIPSFGALEKYDTFETLQQERCQRVSSIILISTTFSICECAFYYVVFRRKDLQKLAVLFICNSVKQLMPKGFVGSSSMNYTAELLFIFIGLYVLFYASLNNIPANTKYDKIFGCSRLMYRANLRFLLYFAVCTLFSTIQYYFSSQPSTQAILFRYPNCLFYVNAAFSLFHGYALVIIYFWLFHSEVPLEGDENEIKVI